MTKNGLPRVRVTPSIVTWPSPIASSSADCVRGVARLTSSARTKLAKIGPATNSKVRSFWLKTLEPVMSDGKRSGVHWIRRNVPPTDVASARASIVLPVPGKSCSSTWPPATRPAAASRTTRSLPTMTRWTFSSMRLRSSAARLGCSSGEAALMPGILVAGPLGTPRLTGLPTRRFAPPSPQGGEERPELAFYVRQFLRDLAVPNLEQVDTANMSGTPVEPPTDHRAVAGDHKLLGLELRLRRASEKVVPELAHRSLADDLLSVGRGQRVLEDAVVGHQCHHGIEVVAAEGFVECVDRLGRRGHQPWPIIRAMTSARLGPPLPKGTECTRCANTISATEPTCVVLTCSALSKAALACAARAQTRSERWPSTSSAIEIWAMSRRISRRSSTSGSVAIASAMCERTSCSSSAWSRTNLCGSSSQS